MPLILVVDDDDQIRTLLRLVLTGAGFAVVDARDGKEGIEAAVRENPDLIITDAAMPGMDGIEMVKQVRASSRFEKVPIIIITGGHPALNQSGQWGADAVFFKPIVPDRILSEINALLGL